MNNPLSEDSIATLLLQLAEEEKENNKRRGECLVMDKLNGNKLTWITLGHLFENQDRYIIC